MTTTSEVSRYIAQETSKSSVEVDFVKNYKQCISNNHSYLEQINIMMKRETENNLKLIEKQSKMTKDFFEKIQAYEDKGILIIALQNLHILEEGISEKYAKEMFFINSLFKKRGILRERLQDIIWWDSKADTNHKVKASPNLIELQKYARQYRVANKVLEGIMNNRQQYLLNITPIMKNGQSNINKLRELVTNQKLYYDIVQNNEIIEIPLEEFDKAILESDYDSRQGNKIDYNYAFQNAVKISEFISIEGKKNHEALEIEVYASAAGISIEEAVKSTDLYKEDTFTYFTGRVGKDGKEQMNTMSLGSLQYYRGGDTARFNEKTGLYEILQQKYTGGIISFDTTYNAMQLIDSTLIGKLSPEQIEKALLNIFTYSRNYKNGKDIGNTVMDAANENAIENIKKVVESLDLQVI